MNLFLIIIYLVLMVATSLALIGIFDRESGAKRLALPQGPFRRSVHLEKIILSVSEMLPFINKFITRIRLKEKLRRNLEAARLNIAPEGYLILKLFIIMVFSVLFLFAFSKLDPALILVAIPLGYMLPDLWLKRRISARKKAIVRHFPETVDLLGLCVEAGLDFISALRWITERIKPNPTIEELSTVAKEIKLGKSKIQALKDMSKRLDIPDLNTFVQTLVQAERMGTPVSESFRIISEDARALRFQRGERLALQAPLKILIPLVLCILPVIGIIVGGPLFLQFMQGDALKGF
jgi:tight adherence protein C